MDLLVRWTVPSTVGRLVRITVLKSSSATDFYWPSQYCIVEARDATVTDLPTNFVLKDEIFRTNSDAIWIPDDSSDLQLLRLCVITHT